jgi:hypothetical protein
MSRNSQNPVTPTSNWHDGCLQPALEQIASRRPARQSRLGAELFAASLPPFLLLSQGLVARLL